MKTITSSSLGLLLAFLGAGEFATEASLAAYRTAVRGESSLISYYPFDSGSPEDTRGANLGTAAGAVSYGLGVGGATDKALTLKGNGHVNLGQVEAFDFVSGKGTIEAWILAGWTSNPGYNPAIFADRDGGSVNWSIHMNSDKGAAGMWNGSTYQPFSIALAGTNWHHLAVVFDLDAAGAATFTVYWDGNPLGSTAQGLGPAPEAPTELGSSSVAGAEEWIGSLDEVALYSEALSAAAVKAHYQAFLSGEPPQITGQPQGGAFLAGIPLTLSVNAKGTDLNYRWFKDGAAVAGASGASLAIASLGAADVGAYQAIVANSGGQATSAVARVELGTLPERLRQYQAAVRVESSLLSYYTFDALDAQDARGAHPGAAQGTVGYGEGIGGGAGKALVLDGAGHVNLGVVPDFSFPSGKGTVEGWIRADWAAGLGYNPAIFACRDLSSVVWSVHMNSGKDAAGLWNGTSYGPQATPGAGGGWHHLAAVFDTDGSGATSFTLYWDGQPAGSTAQGLNGTDPLSVAIGSAAPDGLERWLGAFDEVAFYGDALSAERIQAHYSAFVAGTPPTVSVQPVGGSRFRGGSLTLSVGAQGLDLTYQWYKDGKAIEGATTGALTLAGLTAADAARYQVKISNAAGAVESQEAVVRVILPDVAGYQKAVNGEPGLISYYTFDKGDLLDAKGAYPGTPVDNVGFLTGVGGGSDQALWLDGNAHVDLGVVSAFDFANGLGTVETWVRADWTSGPGYNPTVFAERDGGPVNWSIHLNSGKDAGGLWNGSAYNALTLSNTGTDWHHLAAVFEVDSATGGGLFTLYWDGEQAGQTRQKTSGTTGLPTELGSASVLGQERWIGLLDEVAFYNVPLSADAVRRHYRALVGAPVSSPTLSIQRSGDRVKLSWPADASGFVLESAISLPAGSWTAVSGVSGSSVTLPVDGQSRYYRLRQP